MAYVLDGIQVRQVGIVVRDLETAIAKYSSIFGRVSWVEYFYGPDEVERLVFRGKPAAYSVRVAMSGALEGDGPPQIELIEAVEGPSLYHEFLDSGGSGIHHVGVVVGDLESTIAEMSAAGISVLQSGHGHGVDRDGGFAYFDTLDASGMIIEAIEVPARRREPVRIYG